MVSFGLLRRELGAAEERLPNTTCGAPRVCRFMHSMPRRPGVFHVRRAAGEGLV